MDVILLLCIAAQCLTVVTSDTYSSHLQNASLPNMAISPSQTLSASSVTYRQTSVTVNFYADTPGEQNSINPQTFQSSSANLNFRAWTPSSVSVSNQQSGSPGSPINELPPSDLLAGDGIVSNLHPAISPLQSSQLLSTTNLQAVGNSASYIQPAASQSQISKLSISDSLPGQSSVSSQQPTLTQTQISPSIIYGTDSQSQSETLSSLSTAVFDMPPSSTIRMTPSTVTGFSESDRSEVIVSVLPITISPSTSSELFLHSVTPTVLLESSAPYSWNVHMSALSSTATLATSDRTSLVDESIATSSSTPVLLISQDILSSWEKLAGSSEHDNLIMLSNESMRLPQDTDVFFTSSQGNQPAFSIISSLEHSYSEVLSSYSSIPSQQYITSSDIGSTNIYTTLSETQTEVMSLSSLDILSEDIYSQSDRQQVVETQKVHPSSRYQSSIWGPSSQEIETSEDSDVFVHISASAGEITPGTFQMDMETSTLFQVDIISSSPISFTDIFIVPESSSSEVHVSNVTAEGTVLDSPTPVFVLSSTLLGGESTYLESPSTTWPFYSSESDLAIESVSQQYMSIVTTYTEVSSHCSMCEPSTFSQIMGASQMLSFDLVASSFQKFESSTHLSTSTLSITTVQPLASSDFYFQTDYGEFSSSVSPSTDTLGSLHTLSRLEPSQASTYWIISSVNFSEASSSILRSISESTEQSMTMPSNISYSPLSKEWSSKTLMDVSSSLPSADFLSIFSIVQSSTAVPSEQVSNPLSSTDSLSQSSLSESILTTSDMLPSPSSTISPETSDLQSYSSAFTTTRTSIIRLPSLPPTPAFSIYTSETSLSTPSTSSVAPPKVSTTPEVSTKTTTIPTVTILSNLLISFSFMGDCEKLQKVQNNERVTNTLVRFVSNITQISDTSAITIGSAYCRPNHLPVLLENVARGHIFSKLNKTFSSESGRRWYELQVGEIRINVTSYAELQDKPFKRVSNDIVGADIAVIATATCICIILVIAGVAVFAREIYLKKISEQFTFPDSPRTPLKTEHVALTSIPKHSSVYSGVEMNEERAMDEAYCNPYDVEYSTIDNQLKSHTGTFRKTLADTELGSTDQKISSKRRAETKTSKNEKSPAAVNGARGKPPSSRNYGLVIGLSGFSKRHESSTEDVEEEDPHYAVVDKLAKKPRATNDSDRPKKRVSPPSPPFSSPPQSPSALSPASAQVDSASLSPPPRHLRNVAKTTKISDSHENLLPPAGNDTGTTDKGRTSAAEGVDNPSFSAEKGQVITTSTESFHF